MKLILILALAARALYYIRGEVPVNTAPGIWQIKHTPSRDIACYRNGLRQTISVDYKQVGTQLSSSYWNEKDLLVCDYEW
jgi:hypothetical protein